MNTILDLYDKFLNSSGICTDTRKLAEGQIFFALRGDNFNGNLYAISALQQGASFAIVDEQLDDHPNLIQVDNVLACLQSLANHHRKQFNIPFLGITGSNGKTTTKELTARALSSKYNVLYTEGNLNNHIGVPLTLLRVNKTTEIAIIEMGANHVGDIAELCQIAEPTEGIITNIGTAHIGEFGGKEQIIRGKSELFDYLRKTGGTPFINTEDDVLNNMAKRFENKVHFPDDTKLLSSTPVVHYSDHDGDEHITEITGAYNFMNIAAAISIAKFYGVDYPYNEIDGYIPSNNRSQVVELHTNQIILDAYNANPDSMEAALNNLAKMEATNKVAILGDMFELGEYSEEQHNRIAQLADDLNLTQVYLVGADFLKTNSSATRFQDVDAMVDHLSNKPLEGNIVLIKGSRSMRMENLLLIEGIWI